MLKKSKQTWILENLKWTGEDSWIASSIQDGSCIGVTDGSYMKHLFPTIHSTALVLECQKGRGRLWCSFPKASLTACSYRGELVGLMAIHLLLFVVSETYPALQGSIHIYSDCLCALDKVRNLPPARIPANWAHSDVLKYILVNYRGQMCDWIYSHVKSHQDDTNNYASLSRPHDHPNSTHNGLSRKNHPVGCKSDQSAKARSIPAGTS